ncbi:hypothetical protein [Rhizobium skierniewicense]|uniref:hypothetical protein n=1 Tax=Rhizobium skierniewicense TaxID=984260 RepID=UPI001572F8E6|nr:hypothetical protein [Rhizobium skierniewicense]NTF30973.1 hypothetical protein [Rhizobium skierniewicense]
MSEAEQITRSTPTSLSFARRRFLLVLATPLMFAVGSTVYSIISVPAPVPSNYVRLLLTLLWAELFSLQSVVVCNVILYFGRIFKAPPVDLEQRRWDFPRWIFKQPFFGITLGLSLFCSPLLIVIGLSGIIYLLAAGVVLYFTPRFLAQGAIGHGVFIVLCLVGGCVLSMLLPHKNNAIACEADKIVPLRSGTKVACDEYAFIEKAAGLIIEHRQSSIFVPLKDLAPYEIKALGPGSWLIRSRIRPHL